MPRTVRLVRTPDQELPPAILAKLAPNVLATERRSLARPEPSLLLRPVLALPAHQAPTVGWVVFQLHSLVRPGMPALVLQQLLFKLRVAAIRKEGLQLPAPQCSRAATRATLAPHQVPLDLTLPHVKQAPSQVLQT